MNDRGDRLDAQAMIVAARDWLDRVCAREATAEDEAAMLRWRALSADHAQALTDAMRLRGRMLAARDSLREDPAMQGLLGVRAASGEAGGGLRPSRRAFIGGALAAAAAGAMVVEPPFGLWPSLAELRANYRTGTGERRTVQVAQGLTVELNTRTALDRRPDDEAYRLSLVSGEVAVDARHPLRPAVIEAGAGAARARNGHFGVRLEPEGACVTCFAGEVVVTGRRRPPMRLAAGQQVVIGGDRVGAVTRVDPDAADAWRRGELVFADRPLKEVVKEINRYRPGRIILANSRLGGITVNAVFRLDSLDRAVSQIRAVSQASVTSLPGGVIVLS